MKIKKSEMHMGIAKFIEPTKLDNTDCNGEDRGKDFQTEDLIYLDSYDEVKNISYNARITYPTDYTVMNCAQMSVSNRGSNDRKSCCTWLRLVFSSKRVFAIATNGILNNYFVSNPVCGLCPGMHLNLSSIISARKSHDSAFKIAENNDGEYKYHTIEFGEYPKTYVGKDKNKELEALYSSRRICSTGKTYTGYWDKNSGNFVKNEEFEHEGQKYVRVLTRRCGYDSEYSDGTLAPEDETYLWVKVEPIVWKMRNWGELPKEINPNGNGKAEYIRYPN